jgi:predicted O-linked N-acetylglucosamine transferase (SPINDLY family)
MAAWFEQAGVATDRVTFVGRIAEAKDHLAYYGQVDIALDTYPYHGTTTTCEALWQGVPVITLAGQTHAARVGVSLLSNAGLPELIATTAEDYAERAVALAANSAQLAELRSTLRARMASSPLMDAAGTTRGIEQAYREMWRSWCASA